MRIAWAVLLMLLGPCAWAQPRPDACQAQIPRTLADALAASFPGYRTPLETDNAPEDIQYSRAHGGSGCLGVANADFTGEGKKDYLVGLAALKGGRGMAVVAMPRRGGWRFQPVRSGIEDSRVRQYVDVVAPGRLERAPALTAPLRTSERRSLDCPYWGARVGSVEGTAIVYCHVGGQWLHVQVADRPAQ
jgi:hypothetical protein